MNILVNALIIALFNNGLKLLLSDGMLLNNIYEYLNNRITNDTVRYWMKPLIFCVVCFSSFWGIVVLALLGNLHNINEVILSCICAIPLTLFIFLVNDNLNR